MPLLAVAVEDSKLSELSVLTSKWVRADYMLKGSTVSKRGTLQRTSWRWPLPLNTRF